MGDESGGVRGQILFHPLQQYVNRRGVLLPVAPGAIHLSGEGEVNEDRLVVAAAVSARQRRSREDTLRHVMWLLKYGFVELREP